MGIAPKFLVFREPEPIYSLGFTGTCFSIFSFTARIVASLSEVCADERDYSASLTVTSA